MPGYKQILRALLIEMNELDIIDYPDSLIEASLAFLRNTELLTVYVGIAFEKTNAYDSTTLCSSLSLVVKWISSIEQMGEPFPSNFDFSFFIKGLNVALEIDHHLSTSRTLWCIYKTLHLFPVDQRCHIVYDIFKKHFHKLFFSWSYNIRDVFYDLIVY